MLIIDRFEGNYAIIETDDRAIDIPKSDLPADAKEGDVLRLIIDADKSTLRKKNIEDRMNKLFKDDG